MLPRHMRGPPGALPSHSDASHSIASAGKPLTFMIGIGWAYASCSLSRARRYSAPDSLSAASRLSVPHD